MTYDEIIKLTGAVAGCSVTPLIIKYFSDRRAAREQLANDRSKGDSSLSIEALKSYKDIIQNYREREERHEKRIDSLLLELNELREAKTALVKNTRRFLLLLVDDDEGVTSSVKNFLRESQEFELVSCADWKTAELCFAANRPNLALIDLELPDSTPAETIARVGDFHGSHPSVPVALITAHAIGDHLVSPIGVKIAHKGDVLVSQKHLEAFLYSVLNS